MPTIEKRTNHAGKVTFRARVRVRGARPLSASFARRTDAVRWSQQTEADLRRNKYFPDQIAQHITLADAIDRYITEVLPRKPRTAKYQRPQLEWWRKRLGHLELARVTTRDIGSARSVLQNERGRTRRRRGNSTANRYLAVLAHLFTIAIREWEWLNANPAARLAKLPEPPGRELFLSERECRDLLSACERIDRRLYLVALIAMSTGMRRAEVLTLRRKQIDLEHNMIYLYDTKNGERRGVPLVGPAHADLTIYLQTPLKPEQLLFPSRSGETPFEIRKLWTRAKVDAGVPANLRIHDLRHTAASLLLKDRASLPEIGAVLGHKSVASTKRYAHFAPSHLQGVVARMNEGLGR